MVATNVTSVPETQGAVKKKSYHHGDLRNAIIQEAMARARVSGEKAIVLREIAPLIGVSATAAYRHFANRQQLVEEVSARGYVAMRERVEGSLLTGGGADPALTAYVDLRNAAIAMVEFAVDEPCWARMMLENLGSSPTVDEQADILRDRLQEVVDLGVEAGVFRPGTELRGERTFWAAVDGLSAHAMFGVPSLGAPDAESAADADRAVVRTIDLGMTDLLTDEGRRLRETADLPYGILAQLPR